MSILLDALRKSEKKQQHAEVTTLRLGALADPLPEPLQMGSLVLLLVATLFLSGWSVWRQYQPPTASYRPPVTLAAGKVLAVPTLKTETAVALDKQPVTPPSSVDNKTSATGGSRTPVETFKPASSQAPAVANIAAKPVTKKTGTAQASAAVPKKLPAPIPAPIDYWELPDAVRARVPEMKFSVLVYAKKPAERFVLINGRRFKQGDSYQTGLVVKEIRRDGVIFKYRLYNFLVKR